MHFKMPPQKFHVDLHDIFLVEKFLRLVKSCWIHNNNSDLSYF